MTDPIIKSAQLFSEVSPYLVLKFKDGIPYDDFIEGTPEHIKEKLKEVRRLQALPEYEPIR